MLDLGDVPLIDNHCHQIIHGHSNLGAAEWQGYFTESTDTSMRNMHVATTLAFRRTAKLLAAELGVDPALPPPALAAAVAAARSTLGDAQLAEQLLTHANAEAFLLDDGYPLSARYTDVEFAAFGGATTARIARIEPALERIIPVAATVDEAASRLIAHLDGLPDDTVGLKTAIAYRTGLAIQTWTDAEVTTSFRQAQHTAASGERFRLAHRPLHEHLVRLALRWAAGRQLPVQIHTGYGDADLDLQMSNPAHLQGLLADPTLSDLRLVLLHGSWPYTREAAYMAATYEGVFLDLSYAVPYLSTAEMKAETRAALALAPTSKLMYSSDGVSLPDLHWSSAVSGRHILAETLSDASTDGDLSRHEAEAVGEAVLAGNARELYRL